MLSLSSQTFRLGEQMTAFVGRRDFIILLGGAAAGWPTAARAQQQERMRHISVLLGFRETDPDQRRSVEEFRGSLRQMGWIEGQNVEIAYRYADGDPERARALARELVALQPELLVGHTTPVAAALQQATRTIPIIFISIADPVINGFVSNLARPGGNMTGFTNYEFAMGAKWLEILKEIAPSTARVSLMLSPDTGSYYTEYLRSIEKVALAFAVQATLAPVRNADEIRRAIAALARDADCGLIILPSASITAEIKLIIDLAARYRLPAVYPFRGYTIQGGLVSYGVDVPELFRRATSYIDRILKGDKASDLPVQLPTKFELVVNLKAAKTQGFTFSDSFLLRADEVIE
jgi:putative ABC transport system substrate-binding protein